MAGGAGHRLCDPVRIPADVLCPEDVCRCAAEKEWIPGTARRIVPFRLFTSRGRLLTNTTLCRR
eukprot:scaffold31_cov263-Pinguiococcus_pyrenoidosus.AAC.1